MEKYSKKAILDYINGHSVKGYKISVLENDKDFMLDVLRLTRDPKMYNLCSKKLQSDYLFIREVAHVFANDSEFIKKLYEDYVVQVGKEDITAIELLCIISQFNPRDDNYLRYKALMQVEYIRIKHIINAIFTNDQNQNIKVSFGLGFNIINSEYGSSNILMNYFAKRFIDDIFCENENMTLDDFVHCNFKNLLSVEEHALNAYLIDFLGLYDRNLKEYIILHQEVLEPIKKELRRAKNNWEYYQKNANKRKVLIILQEVDKYCDEYGQDNTVDYYGILGSVVDELKLEDIFKDELLKTDLPEYLDPQDEVVAKKFRKDIKNKITELFESEYIESNCSDYDQKRLKIINFDFEKKRMS